MTVLGLILFLADKDRLFAGLSNWFNLVDVPFGQIKLHICCTHVAEAQTSKEGTECTKVKEQIGA